MFPHKSYICSNIATKNPCDKSVVGITLIQRVPIIIIRKCKCTISITTDIVDTLPMIHCVRIGDNFNVFL